MAKYMTKPIESFDQKYFHNIDALTQELEKEREQGKRVVFTNGCFDLIHVSHTRHFDYSKSINGEDKIEPHYNSNNVLVVAVNSDESIKALGREYVFPLEERLEILSALEAIDYLCRIDGKTTAPLLEKIRPPIVTKGNDYRVDPENPLDYVEGFERVLFNPEERKIIESYGGRIIITPYSTKKHSRDIMKSIKEKEEMFREK